MSASAVGRMQAEGLHSLRERKEEWRRRRKRTQVRVGEANDLHPLLVLHKSGRSPSYAWLEGRYTEGKGLGLLEKDKDASPGERQR